MANTKRARLREWIAGHPEKIGPAEFEALKEHLGPVSENYLRKMVRESGAPLDPMVEGVRQSSLEELEASLLKFLDEYERGDREHRKAVRKLVIMAKDHAKWAHKDEAVLWLTTWLENPPLFREWVTLRKDLIEPRIHADERG